MNFRKIYLLHMLFSFSIFAVSPKTVTHDSKPDFERGTLTNVTILHDGTLMPAPVKTRVVDTGEPFVWAMAEDSKGNLYVGTGNNGKLYKVSPKGDSSLVIDTDELGIFALAVDQQDNVYAASSPAGKVYKIDPSGKSTTFFDPDASYIWDLEIDAQNNILVATGEKAFIYSVTPKGESSIVFQGEEDHVRTLALHSDGTIYAGTSAKGFVYRIKPNEKPFVLFDPQMEEVNGLVFGNDGYIYASAFGQAFVPPVPRILQQRQPQDENGANGEDGENEAALAAQTISIESLVRSAGAPTSLFRISPDGYAKDLWLGVNEKIQSILAYDDDTVLVGSGKSGTLMTMNKNGDVSILMENDESHITSLLKNRKNKFIFGTSNLGRLYQIESVSVDSALFESETIDAGLPARWGTLAWKGNDSASLTKFYTRTGNTEHPSQTWSDWLPVEKDGDVSRIKSSDARFLQWKCEFRKKDAHINKVTASYIQKNLAPSVSSIIVHRSGDFYETKANNKKVSQGLTFPAPLPSKQTKKGYRSVDWLFQDPNFDGLSFDVFYRRVGSTVWRELATDLDINIHSWDSAQMSDGEYEIKVAASDKLANPEILVLSGDKTSKAFVIDNSGPIIKTGNNKKGDVLTVRITDEWTLLEKVEYSLDAQDWKIVFPIDGIMDSKSELFEIKLLNGSQEVAIKAHDSIDNVSVVHISTK